MTKQADVLAYIFDGQSHLLSDELMLWLEASSRFTDFVENYRDKIRKKVRVTREQESVKDLRGELMVAYCLLNDRRLEVAYEPYGSEKRRRPDFKVTYKANLVFNVEVTRIRVEVSRIKGFDPIQKEDRILRTLIYKMGQMQPGMPNLLILNTLEELVQSIDLDRYMQEVKARIEKKDPSFYAITPYTSPADFYKDFYHLSCIISWANSVQMWVNKQTRSVLDKKVLLLVSSMLTGNSQS